MRSIDKEKIIVGVDEVGRGPLAGPVAVGVVVTTKDFVTRFKRSVFFTDSKKMKELDREEVFKKINEQKKDVIYTISFISAGKIDKIGINKAIFEGIKRSLDRLDVEKDIRIFLDGGLSAPSCFVKQKTIKGGDGTEDVISLASVLAKVKRDRRMLRYDRIYPEYGFSSNKGYGTKRHIESIKERGLCKTHRKTFIKKI